MKKMVNPLGEKEGGQLTKKGEYRKKNDMEKGGPGERKLKIKRKNSFSLKKAHMQRKEESPGSNSLERSLKLSDSPCHSFTHLKQRR